ncbi:MAG: DUF937 domain-containing protein [Burkholderiales bacterium]|nr:DUF937 domain-containing protein [Burkholderiales bacterium]
MNILESLSGVVSEELVAQASKFLGESPAATRGAVGSAIPALLAGLMQKTSSTQGATDLFRTLTGPSVDAGILDNLSGLFTGGDRTNSLMRSGASLLSGILGSDKLGNLSGAIASLAGIKSSAATSLLSMAAPLLLGSIKKQVTTRGLDAAGLASLLLGQKSALQGAGLDPSIVKSLGFGSLSGLLGSIPDAGAAAARGVSNAAAAGSSGLRRWWPWLLAALVLLLLWQWLGRSKPPAPLPPAATSEAPAPAAVAGWPGKVYFATGSAEIDAQASEAISAIAALAIAENASVDVTGYTDQTGDPVVNEELAKERAQNVQAALIAAGLPESNVHLQPPVFITGSGDDAEARRVEVNRAP